MKVIGIIPARYNSTRFPGKPLIDLGGKSMIQRVYEQAKKSNLDRIIVATDDQRIIALVESFAGDAVLTSTTHLSGTDRCWEGLQKINTDFNAIINIQGDEPFINPEQINKVIHALNNNEVVTLAIPFKNLQNFKNYNKVKVILNDLWIATDFKRKIDTINYHNYYKHIGIYGYQKNILEKITKLKQSKREIKENLEQLRWIENGISIKVELTSHDSISIDTPEDIKKILHLL